MSGIGALFRPSTRTPGEPRTRWVGIFMPPFTAAPTERHHLPERPRDAAADDRLGYTGLDRSTLGRHEIIRRPVTFIATRRFTRSSSSAGVARCPR